MTKVLIVEPDSSLLAIYKSAFSESGYSVEAVTDAQEALKSSDRKEPDIVVLELQLVGHNGVEFLYEFRSYPEWQNIPVLVHSILPPGEFRSSNVLWKDLKISNYLYKPKTSLRQLLDNVAMHT